MSSLFYIHNCFPVSPYYLSNNFCDDRIQPVWYKRSSTKGTQTVRPRYVERWWQRSRMHGYDITTDGVYVGVDVPMMAQWPYYHRRTTKAGAKTRLLIKGITRDANHNPIGTVVVKAFLTADNTFVGQVTSDTTGAYVIPTPYTGAHYIVAILQSGTDSIGVTDNDRVGS